jgi:nucleotide-binding universal stress UspA family protein
MRLLLATDGSTGAATAAGLVAGLSWPAGTTVDVVRVVDTMLSTWAYAPVPDLQVPHEQMLLEARQSVDLTAAHLRSHGLRATSVVLQGPEIPTLVDRATTTAVDLVVCGSRGRGHIRSLMLGSVSAGIAARTPCSVLVARHPTVTSVILAVDGSPSATAAERLVMELPMFEGPTLDLVTVTGQPVGPEDEWQAHVRLMAQLQHSVGDRLRDQGREPYEVLLTGRPASEIVDQARASGADLIVLGAHAQTSLDKLLLGSTTLDVLVHSPTSVLVARGPVIRQVDRGRSVGVRSGQAKPPVEVGAVPA